MVLGVPKVGKSRGMHVSGLLNPSDDLAKALGWILHARHARRSMGHCRHGSPTQTSLASAPLAPHVRAESNKVGEGVGAQNKGDRPSPGLEGVTGANMARHVYDS